jgi:hypothetical protein
LNAANRNVTSYINHLAPESEHPGAIDTGKSVSALTGKEKIIKTG